MNGLHTMIQMENILDPEVEAAQLVTKIEEALENLVNICVQYKCVDRDILVCNSKIVQQLYTRLFKMGLRENHYIFTGSKYEVLPPEVCNDQFILTIHRDNNIVLPEHSGHKYDKHEEGHLVATASPHHPAFLKLKDCTHGNRWLKTKNIDSSNHGDCEKTKNSSISCDERADKRTKSRDIPVRFKPQLQQQSSRTEKDTYPAYYCPEWPGCAAGYLTRPRPSGWPEPALVRELARHGCHVVPLTLQTSPLILQANLPEAADQEWRWSFAMVTKELFHKAPSPVQGAYYALKAVKQKTWTEEGKSTSLCAYVIKTACLYLGEGCLMIESVKVIDMCKAVLDWLILCYKRQALPHYFLPEHNLIGHLNAEQLDEVLDWLVAVRTDLCQFILYSIEVNAPDPDTYKTKLDLIFENIKPDPEKAFQKVISLTSSLETGSPLYRSAWYTGLSSHLGSYSALKHMLFTRLSSSGGIYSTTPESGGKGLDALPVDIILPLIENLDEILGDKTCRDYRPLFRQILYRNIAECIHSLAAYHLSVVSHNQCGLNDKGGRKSSEGRRSNRRKISKFTKKYADPNIGELYLTRAIYYYELSGDVVHPDGWTDGGFTSTILLAKLYYLQNLFSYLTEKIPKLELMADKYKTQEDIARLQLTYVERTSYLSVRVWINDREFCQRLLDTDDIDCMLFIHPLSLAYYIMGRYYLYNGEISPARRTVCALKQLQPSLAQLGNSDLLKTNKTMTKILEKIIKSRQSVFTNIISNVARFFRT